MGRFGKKVHVNVNPLDASVILCGSEKIGKTTLMKQVAEKLTNPNDGYMLLELFREQGADLIEGAIAENVPDWSTFDEIVTDIEENKASDYPNLKLIIIDTLDNAMLLAEQETIRIWNRANPDKKVDSISAAYSGFGRGQDKAIELFQDMIYRLKAVGVQVWIITHVKAKDVIDPITQATYQQVTADVTQKYFNSIKKNYDIIAVAYVDREIKKEGLGRKNLVTHKEETRDIVKSETRKIKFRDSDYVIDAGGRLSGIVEEIPFDADAFIKAITDALAIEVGKGGVKVEDRRKENDAEEKEFEQKVAAQEEANREAKQLESIRSQIKDFCIANKTTNKEAVVKLMTEAKSLGLKNPLEVDNLNDAKKLLALCA